MVILIRHSPHKKPTLNAEMVSPVTIDSLAPPQSMIWTLRPPGRASGAATCGGMRRRVMQIGGGQRVEQAVWMATPTPPLNILPPTITHLCPVLVHECEEQLQVPQRPLAGAHGVGQELHVNHPGGVGVGGGHG